jgi:hypothetical protein
MHYPIPERIPDEIPHLSRYRSRAHREQDYVSFMIRETQLRVQREKAAGIYVAPEWPGNHGALPTALSSKAARRPRPKPVLTSELVLLPQSGLPSGWTRRNLLR